MKQIKAIIQPHMLQHVMTALQSLPHFPGITVAEVKGEGRGMGKGHAFAATLDTVFETSHKLIEIVCADELAPKIVKSLQQAAHTGHPGDGIIVVTDVAQVIRIRTGERNDSAV